MAQCLSNWITDHKSVSLNPSIAKMPLLDPLSKTLNPQVNKSDKCNLPWIRTAAKSVCGVKSLNI